MQFQYLIPLNSSFAHNVALFKSFIPDCREIGALPGEGHMFETNQRLTPQQAQLAGATLHTQSHTTPPKRRQPRQQPIRQQRTIHQLLLAAH